LGHHNVSLPVAATASTAITEIARSTEATLLMLIPVRFFHMLFLSRFPFYLEWRTEVTWRPSHSFSEDGGSRTHEAFHPPS